MCCSSSSSSAWSSSGPLLDLLPTPVLELVLARLPILSALSAASTCKSLHTIIRASRPFALLQHTLLPENRAPWFFLLGINHIVPLKSQLFAFDPSSAAWLRLPFPSPPTHNHASLSAANGLFFALSGASQDKLCFPASPLTRPVWRTTPPMRFPRSSPLVAVLPSPSSPSACTAVVAAGVDATAGGVDGIAGADLLAVEIYDQASGQWEGCPPVPAWILAEHAGGSSKLLSAVHAGRFYVADCYSSRLCVLDVGERTWRRVACERPEGVMWWQPVGCESGLVMVALCWNATEGSCVKVLRLGDGGCEKVGVEEVVGTMPGGLFEGMVDQEGEEGGSKLAALRCAGGGDLVYVYSDSPFKDYAACACNVRTGTWTSLPPLPPPVSRFDRVLCASTAVTLAAF